MALVVGTIHILVGLAYCGMGLLSAWESFHQYRQRGLSRFGLGFSVMAASCGPHHLVHGWCVLHGGAVSGPMLVVALLGLPAGMVFCALRAEVMAGGQGDRVVAVKLPTMVAAALGFLVTVGALAGWAVAAPVSLLNLPICTVLGTTYAPSSADGGMDFASPVVLANLWVTVAYVMVGWYLFDTQMRRYTATRTWSLSGLALAGIFPTCAAMHLITALTGGHGATLPFDLLGVPASTYFLWVIKQLHTDSVADWNRRPLAGVGARPTRPSPWSESQQ